MAASTLTGKTNGDYYFNGNIIPSGTSLTFKITNGKINVNSKEYDSVIIAPKSYGSFFYLTGSSRTNRYMGILEFKVDNNRVYPINTLPIEDYLNGVVGYEMSEAYPIEALKAQAVAARTYALKHKGDLMETKGFDFDDTICYQVYYGYNPTFINVEKSVKGTVGQVILYSNNLIDALFSSSHGGYTENAANVWGNSVAYLTAKPDTFNGQVIDNDPWSMGPKLFTIADVETNLKLRGYLTLTDKFVKLNLNSITKYTSGRVSNIDVVYQDVNGASKIKKITADNCRTFLPLQSSMWDLTFDGSIYRFTGKGFGHGLGMSQIGAKQRALLGQAYNDILKFYYNSTQLATLYVSPKLGAYTQSKTQVYIGQPITLNAQGQDGTGNYLYKYVVLRNGVSILDTGYTNSSNYTYIPLEPGNYQLTVYLKDTQSDKSFDDSKSLYVKTLEIPSITSVTSEGTNSIVNQQLTFAAQTKGGSGDFLYKYTVLQDGKLVAETSFVDSKTYSYTPNATGCYEVIAYIKDKVDLNREIAPLSTKVNIYKVPQISATSISGTMYVSKAISMNTIYTAGSPQGSQVKYEVYRNNVLYYLRNYSLDKNYSFVPTAAGSYTVKIYLKDATSKSSYDSLKSYTINIQSLPLTLTKIPLTYGMNSADVTALQNALKKLNYKITSVTGYYGAQTKAAVIAFQKSKALKQTGIVDKVTFETINDSLISKAK